MSKDKNWKELLKTEQITNIGKISVGSKNILLVAGKSMSGKTVTCLHFTEQAIKKKMKVLYFDTENKSIISRPEPNLFKKLHKKNEKGYTQYFSYRDNIDNLFEDIKQEKPKLIIIDSLYQPFLKKYSEPRTRAMKIKEYLTKIRELVWNESIGCIITTPIGKITQPSTGENKQEILGGEGMKYLADVKLMIQFVDKQDKDSDIGDKRLFVIDRNHQILFHIGYGGELIEA